MSVTGTLRGFGSSRAGRGDADLEELCARIEQLEAEIRKPAARRGPWSEEKLVRTARHILAARQRRGRVLNPALFSEPAWDMLLELFISYAAGRRVATSSLSTVSNTPQSTGLRWLGVLERNGLTKRSELRHDRRYAMVELTPKGYELMCDVLSEWVVED